MNFREYILKIAHNRSILAHYAPNSVWRPGSTPSWIKETLLLRKGDGKGVEGGEKRGWEGREEYGIGRGGRRSGMV